MVSVDEFSRLVDVVYAGVTASTQWAEPIVHMNRALGGSGGAMLTASAAVWTIDNAVLPSGAAKDYAERYCHLDFTRAVIQAGPIGAVRTAAELVHPHRGTEFYRDWLHPNGLEDALYVRLDVGEPMCCIMHTENRAERFDTPGRMQLMAALAPHLQRAGRMKRRLGIAIDLNSDLAGALSAVGHGLVVIGPGGSVVFVNAVAEDILRAEDGLRFRLGRIAAASPNAQRAWRCATQRALVGDGETRSGQSFFCDRPSGKRPYVIRVIPLLHPITREGGAEPTALVSITDPEDRPSPQNELWRRLYGLTETESQVALHIMEGDSTRQIASELSVSFATVRTHLQHVFEKTGTHRQGELVRLLMAISPP